MNLSQFGTGADGWWRMRDRARQFSPLRKWLISKGLLSLLRQLNPLSQFDGFWAVTCFFAQAHMANVTQLSWKVKRTEAVAFSLLGIVMLAVTGSLACRKPSPATNDATDIQDRGVLHLEPFVVNLADPEDNRFLRVGIDLGLEKQPSGKESDASAARVRDCIILILSTWRSDALLAPDGKQKLKDEILHALQDRVPDLGVREVYFTDFLVQR
jgi:flagellar basal body-associated protein FliL